MTTEQKLRLIQQIRSRYNENQYDMSNREQIIYGKSIPREMFEETKQENPDGDAKTVLSSFKLRCMLALLLVAAMIFLDRNHIKIAGITSDQIYQAISADFEDNIEKMVAALSQNTETVTTPEN